MSHKQSFYMCNRHSTIAENNIYLSEPQLLSIQETLSSNKTYLQNIEAAMQKFIVDKMKWKRLTPTDFHITFYLRNSQNK